METDRAARLSAVSDTRTGSAARPHPTPIICVKSPPVDPDKGTTGVSLYTPFWI